MNASGHTTLKIAAAYRTHEAHVTLFRYGSHFLRSLRAFKYGGPICRARKAHVGTLTCGLHMFCARRRCCYGCRCYGCQLPSSPLSVFPALNQQLVSRYDPIIVEIDVSANELKRESSASSQRLSQCLVTYDILGRVDVGCE